MESKLTSWARATVRHAAAYLPAGSSPAAAMHLLVRTLERPSVFVVDLDKPDAWPTAVWIAFERAQAERIRRTDVATDQRRHDGNTLVHPSVSYQSALAELDGRPVVCKNTVNVRERIAPHLPLSRRPRSPHGDPLH